MGATREGHQTDDAFMNVVARSTIMFLSVLASIRVAVAILLPLP
jgi:hypothetical protein